MEKNGDKLTPEAFGEMYVTWRLEEGLFSSEDGEKRVTLMDSDMRREIALNDFAREIGAIMMPYLSSHPDVGFDSFRRNLWEMAKIGNVRYHSAKLDDEYPHIQILEAVSSACASHGDCHPSVMTAYVVLGRNQKIHMHQYARLKLQTCLKCGIKHLDLNIIYDEDTNPNEIGCIQILMA